MPRDHADALDLYLKQADGGNSEASFRLGVMYGLGLGVSQDHAQSIKWYRVAAIRGNLRAQSNLGWMYGTGRGVPQDFIEAYAWYSVAAAGGEATARTNRDLMSERMTSTQLEEAQRLSKQLVEQIDKR